MTATHDRLTSERAFHDRQARQRFESFHANPSAWRFDDDSYLDHESWIRPAFTQLGDVRGRRVLDCGCGHGMAAIILAHRGARVTAFDLSTGYLAEARQRALVNQADVCFLAGNGDQLPFADASFGRIWGNAILHHLDLRLAGPELLRVLEPGGVAVFCEPWGENPLLNWARRVLPYPGKQRTPDEQPLRQRDLHILCRLFASVEVQGYQFLSMLKRVLPGRRLAAGLERCDRFLLQHFPGLQRGCRYIVLTLRKAA